MNVNEALQYADNSGGAGDNFREAMTTLAAEVRRLKCPSDIVTDCKIAVIRSALGIQTLEEKELLDRLEDLYLSGVKAGYEAKG